MPATDDVTVIVVHPCVAGAACIAQMASDAGLGTRGGAVYEPVALIVPIVALPPGTPLTAHVNGPLPPAVTENCCVTLVSTAIAPGATTSGPTTETAVVAVKDSIVAVIVA